MEELNGTCYHSILADEVTSHNAEHLAICGRFVDKNKNVREEFLTFLQLERVTGEKIAESILDFLKESNIPVENMHGQGYDGASNMSSDRVGVQARIREKAPLATYVHCNGHCLNLVISKSCTLPQVHNVISRLQECCCFFLNSPKRSGLLDLIVNHNVVYAAKRKPLLDLCKTRWAEWHFACQHFYQAFCQVRNKYADWDPASCSNAQQILASITTFEFIVVFMTMYQYLSHLSGITVKLQKGALDIVEANEMISEIATIHKDKRKSVDSSFGRIFAQSTTMAEKVGAIVSMPRIASRQGHRSNIEASSPCEYFQRNVTIPILDHIIMSIDQQFSPSAIIATSLLGLVPSVLFQKESTLRLP